MNRPDFWSFMFIGIGAWASMYQWIVTSKRLRQSQREVRRLNIEANRYRVWLFRNHDHWEVGEGRIRHQ